MSELLELVSQYWAFEHIAGFDPDRIGTLLGRVLQEPALGRIWVAQSQSALVGYLIAVFMLSVEHQGVMAEIDEFFVAPQVRSQRIGELLLSTAETALTAYGCTRVQLQLGRDNSAARAFYRRHGYQDRAGYELLDKPLHPRPC